MSTESKMPLNVGALKGGNRLLDTYDLIVITFYTNRGGMSRVFVNGIYFPLFYQQGLERWDFSLGDMIRKRELKKWFYSYDMIFEQDISIYALALYMYLCRCADNEGQSFPSHKTLAKACKMGVTSVKSAINELIDIKLLDKQHQFTPRGRKTSNIYTIYDTPNIDGM